MSGTVAILGVFVADTAYRADRLPAMGETVLGRSFALGPGGKGSNQAVAAARAGGEVHFISRLGMDAFGDMALETWTAAGVRPQITRHDDLATGAAFIFVDAASGDNAIIIAPGAAATISPADVDAAASVIAGADVFVTQLEQPLDAAMRGLALARENGVATILNPAPAAELPDAMLTLCDYLTPNETEAAALTGLPVADLAQAEAAAQALRDRGVGTVIVTLGENGALIVGPDGARHVPALHAGDVVETTGAGDAFNGGLATALARGDGIRDAVRFATATAAISVTRAGTAPSMPSLAEIEALLAR